jgi:hypothetical protein
MIDFIENKENTNLYHFFLKHKYTEFFLYFAWLCFVNKKDNYIYLNKLSSNVIVGPFDPTKFVWNSWDAKINHIKTYNPNVFSLSSKCVSIINKEYKNNIKIYLNNIFNNDMINGAIANALNL